MKAIILFSPFAGIKIVLEEEKYRQKLFGNINAKEFIEKKIFVFDSANFNVYGNKRISKDSIFVVHDEIPYGEFKNFLRYTNAEKFIFIIHREPSKDDFRKFLFELAFRVFEGQHEKEPIEDKRYYKEIYKELSSISFGEPDECDLKVSNLIDRYFSESSEIIDLDRKLGLLHKLLLPSGIEGNEDVINKYIKEYEMEYDLSELKISNFQDDKYQTFLTELRNKLLDNLK